MNRTLGAVVVAAAMVAAPGRAHVGARQVMPMPLEVARARVDALFAAYSAGDVAVVERSLVTRDDFQFTSALSTVFIQSAGKYSRMRAAFLMDIAVAAFRHQEPGAMLAALNTGRFVVTNRDARLGASEIDDRFEVMWHELALALMDGVSQPVWRFDYLGAIVPRFAEAAGRGVTIANRFTLARAETTEELCCPSRMRGATIVVAVRQGTRTIGPAERPGVSDGEALTLYESAAADAPLAAEARVRGASLLLRLGRLDESLAWLGKMPTTDDALVNFAAALVRGRVLDGLSKPDAAADSYENAQRAVPTAQVPAIGRAAALLRAGRTDEALAAADSARRLPSMPSDPWETFQQGDARFILAWLDEIRELRR